jgi:hypothetical protein
MVKYIKKVRPRNNNFVLAGTAPLTLHFPVTFHLYRNTRKTWLSWLLNLNPTLSFPSLLWRSIFNIARVCMAPDEA